MNDDSGGEVGQVSPAGVPEPQEYAGDDPRALREQVELTRARLGDTVEELAARADVRAIARRRAAAVRERLGRRPGPVPLIAAGAVVTACAAGAVVRRHRHGGR